MGRTPQEADLRGQITLLELWGGQTPGQKTRGGHLDSKIMISIGKKSCSLEM